MKPSLSADEADFFGPAFADPVRARQLDSALRRLGAGREQEDLVQSCRGKSDQILGQLGPFFAGENVIMEQTAFNLVDNRLAHLARAMTGISHQDAAAPIEPL